MRQARGMELGAKLCLMSEMDGLMPAEKAHFSTLFLANHVEVQNGLLYIAGGGWTYHRRVPVRPDGQRTVSRLGIAGMVKVPWAETNRKQRFLIEVTDQEGGAQLVKIEGELNAGRPADLEPGSAQHMPLAITADTVFAHAGSYVVRGVLNDDASNALSWEFQVFDLPVPPQAAI